MGWLIALLWAWGCHSSSSLTRASGELRLFVDGADVDGSLSFGGMYVGAQSERTVKLSNSGQREVTLDWSALQSPFSAAALPTSAPPGVVTFQIHAAPSQVGIALANLEVHSADGTAHLAIRAEGLAIPSCGVPESCRTLHFDVTTGRCVETLLSDGESCDPHSACVLDATCHAGRCVGTPRVCDDGNACTLDSCNALSGCVFVPAPPCPGDGKCQVGVCDPKNGCGLAPADDGTICGKSTCDAAQVCISGACVIRDPPDGFVCAPASPCQEEGVCQGSTCVQPAKTALAPSWSFDSSADPTGAGPTELHDFVIDGAGRLSLFGFFSSPVTRANTNSRIALSDTARRCILWNEQLACADFGSGGGDGQVALVDPASGTTRWVFNLGTARPDYAARSEHLFMARVAALGTDRLAAIFEAYPKGSAQGSMCRLYYLVLLDAGGGLVSAEPLTDPALDTCDHPHPYGVASDVDGNLYLAFSPTSSEGAPLAALSPTLLVSYSREGVLRWKRNETYEGGELAVAKGLVFPEHALVPLRADSGAPVGGNGTVPLGRVVVSQGGYVQSPQLSILQPDRFLHRYGLDGSPSWTYELPQGGSFLTRELRLARWSPAHAGSQTAVLSFVDRGAGGELLAVSERNGEELWSCPVSSPVSNAPQLFEIAGDTVGLMGNATTCGDCDPPFARSSASFFTFHAPGLSLSDEPWAGTFGGPTHGHHEQGLPTLPSTP